MSGQQTRLTGADFAAIDQRLTERIGDLVAIWARNHPHHYQPHAHEWKRLAHHAIGCSEVDLRDTELANIAAQVEAICAYYRNGATR